MRRLAIFLAAGMCFIGHGLTMGLIRDSYMDLNSELIDFDNLNNDISGEIRYLDLDDPLQYVEKRGCIRRGGNCDHRPKDCCNGNSCRCHIWASNCRCHRKGNCRGR